MQTKPSSGSAPTIVPRQQTRAEIDVDFENGLSGSWNEVDILGVIHKAPGSQDFSALGQFAFDPESRTFKGTLPSQTGEWHYRAFYPHNGTASVSGSKTTVTVPFSALRTQEGNKYNSEYDLLAADAILYPERRPGHDTPGRSPQIQPQPVSRRSSHCACRAAQRRKRWLRLC